MSSAALPTIWRTSTEMTQALSSWLVGHFSLVLKGRYEIVWLTVPLVVLAFLFANHFNIVGLGKDFFPRTWVSRTTWFSFSGLTIAAMITASIVVVVGSISYIGLIVPNVVAMYKGDKIRGTLVDTALFGAIFVLVCDMIGRIVIAPYELPIELIVGILGSLIFIALLFYRLKHGRKGHPSGRRRNKLLLHHAQPEGRCRPVNTVAIRANRRKLPDFGLSGFALRGRLYAG